MTRFRTEVIGDHRMVLGDTRDVLETLGTFDAVVTDPPYGIRAASGTGGSNPARAHAAGLGRNVEARDFRPSEWDNAPIAEELLNRVRRAGRWQIIFGGNYYDCPATSCWLIWDKLNTGHFADCELAWTNLPTAVRRLRYLWNGAIRANGEIRGDHPTQKPIGVMAWCLQQLPLGTRTVLDPFAGSGTTGVACVRAGMAFTGIEREVRYFDAACRRIAEEVAKPRLFSGPPPKPKQEALL
jgi:DNA modification methylase